MLEPVTLVLRLDESFPAGGRKESDDVHDIEVGLGFSTRARDVRGGEPVGGIAAVADGDVGAAVRNVQPRRAYRRLVNRPGFRGGSVTWIRPR